MVLLIRIPVGSAVDVWSEVLGPGLTCEPVWST